MRKILFSILSSVLFLTIANAAPHPTVCQRVDTKCYSDMATFPNGYVADDWDATSNCWGKKIICSSAVLDSTKLSGTTLSKNEISSGLSSRAISSDFNLSIYIPAQGCFGERKVESGYTQYNGDRCKVYCSGAISDGTEVPGGLVLLSGGKCQPAKCSDFSTNYIDKLVSNKCFGEELSDKYIVDCNFNGSTAIVNTNGSDSASISSSSIADKASLVKIMNDMYSTAAKNKSKNFYRTPEIISND